MKKILLGLGLLVNTLIYSQIEVTIQGSNVFLEYTTNESFNIMKEDIRLGPSAKTSLKQALNKAVEWAELNETHKKSFEKIICSFRVMDTGTYNHFGYSEFHSKEMVIEFKGYSNGEFDLNLTIKNPPFSSSSISLNSLKQLKDFKKILNGQSINPEIDEIFK